VVLLTLQGDRQLFKVTGLRIAIPLTAVESRRRSGLDERAAAVQLVQGQGGVASTVGGSSPPQMPVRPEANLNAVQIQAR
jgi:hypothetical protein